MTFKLTDRATQIALAFIIPLLLNISVPYSVDDLAGWIAHGLYFLDHHQILRTDGFSVLPTQPLVYCSWGISVLYALIFKVGGLLSVCFFHTLLFALLLWIIYRNSIFKLKNFDQLKTRLFLYLFWLASIPAVSARPSLAALIPLVIGYLEISRIEGEMTLLDTSKLILLNIAWVNIHGSFILLPVMFAWRMLWDRKNFRASQAFALFAILASTWINPFHFEVFPYVFKTFAISRERITEWNSLLNWRQTHLASEISEILFFAVFFGSACFLWKKRRSGKSELTRLISSPYFLLLLLGFLAIRNVTLPLFVFLPFCFQVGVLEDSPEELSAHAWNGAKVVFASLLLVVSSPFFHGSFRNFDDTAAPEIANAIRERNEKKPDEKPCPVFNDWELGSYFILELPNRIFLDWRNVIYSDQEIAEYRRAIQAQAGWESYLERYHACFAALKQPDDQPLIDAMSASPLWTAVAREKSTILFQRRI